MRRAGGPAAGAVAGHGRRLAGQLVALCEASLAGVDGDGTRIDPRPTVHVVISADALLDVDRTPGWLLTPLAGGRIRASAAQVQRLVDQRGADLHTVVLDEVGQIVGVGTGTYRPPGWLREAIWARDTLDISPDGRTAVRRCDLDHIVPWPDGPTDVDNLAPIGRTAHRMKTTHKWKVTRARDGTTTWTHRPTGLNVTRPPTWRALTDPPRDPEPGPPRLPLHLLDEPSGVGHQVCSAVGSRNSSRLPNGSSA